MVNSKHITTWIFLESMCMLVQYLTEFNNRYNIAHTVGPKYVQSNANIQQTRNITYLTGFQWSGYIRFLTDYWLLVTGYRLLTTCCWLLPATGYWLMVTKYNRLLFTDYCLLVTGHLRLFAGYWLLVNGYCLMAAGYLLLVTGYCLLVTGYWLLVMGY
jgi:hypothetical protein